MSLINGLNDKQREAVLKTEGPLLILAGAGSGKTRVLTHRIAYLIEEKGVSPWNILALTFTNKAAGEMKERIGNLIGHGGQDVWAGTFHSVCVRILRRDIEKIGYSSNYVIFDSADQKTLVRDCIKELSLSEKLYDPKAMLGFISSQKNIMVKSDTYINANYTNFRERQKGEIYALYQKKLKENNALDFDDLINKTIELFKEHPMVLEYYQNKFHYVLVDEYQDTNGAQYELVRLLASKYKNICVVGDDDQSIYGWRGADIANILNFEKDYLDASVIKLEQNYRSTKTILNAANEVIQNNSGRKNKKLWTGNDEGQQINIYSGNNEHEEADFIVKKIKEIKNDENKSYSDFSILYRTNAQSRVLEESFMRANMPYKIVGGLKFYDRKEIKDIVSYLRLIQNPVDNISLKRIINVPKRGIGKTTIDKIEEYSLSKEESIYSVILDIEELGSLSQRAKGKVREFASLIGTFIAMKEVLSVKDLIEKVIESSRYISELEKEDTVEARTRIENIKEFVSVAIDFDVNNPGGTLEDFLANIALLSDIDKTEDGNDEAVTLMTLHSAKGLEFPVVFISGMEEGMFPSSRSLTSQADLEEERRLCYVGITRAEETLFITHTAIRTIFGRKNFNTVSRFIREIPKELIKSCNENKRISEIATSSTKPKESKRYFTGYVKENVVKEEKKGKVTAGMKVKHKVWGIGTVVQTKETSNDIELTIVFPAQGIKRLLKSIAPISIIND